MKDFIFPSIYKDKLPKVKLLFNDYYMLFIIIFMPTCFLGFMNADWFYIIGLMDLHFFVVLLTVPMLFLSKSNTKILKISGGTWLFLSCLYIFFKCFDSIECGIQLKEIVTILRKNLIYPIPAFIVLLCLGRFKNNQLYSIIRIIIIVSIIQAVLLCISLVTRIDFFLWKAAKEDTAIIVNLNAYPLFQMETLALLFGSLLLKNGSFKINMTLVGLLVALPFLCLLRGASVTNVFLLFFFNILYLAFVRDSTGKIATTIKFLALGLFFCSFIFLMFPNNLDQYLEKWGVGKEEVDAGTLDFRKNLVEKAWHKINDNKRPVLGVGYIRESKNLGYDYVLGTDTFIPPVLATEGILGLFLRCMPILILLFVNLSRLFVYNDKKLKMLSITIVSIIMSQVLGYMQTYIFCYYTHTMLILFILEMIRYNYQHDEQFAEDDC